MSSNTHSRRALRLALAAAFSLGLATSASWAQTAAAPATGSAAAPQAWKYKTKRLNKDEVDALLAQPERVVFLDVRRPDELIKYGSFPAFLNIQNKDVEKHLAYLPKDRLIVTVSNHAQRAGATGDLLAAKGFQVAGATGSEDYEQEGGKQVAHINPPPPRAPGAGGAAAAGAAGAATLEGAAAPAAPALK